MRKFYLPGRAGRRAPQWPDGICRRGTCSGTCCYILGQFLLHRPYVDTRFCEEVVQFPPGFLRGYLTVTGPPETLVDPAD